MKVIITRATFVGGKLHEPAEDPKRTKPVDLDDKDAKTLIAMGKATPIKRGGDED